MTTLQKETICFGKYEGKPLEELLRDRKYCNWLTEQDWFKTQNEYLYNRIKEHNPKRFFFRTDKKEMKENKDVFKNLQDFLDNYTFFHLVPLKELEIPLSNTEKKCYQFYLDMIQTLKDKVEYNEDNNPYNIKAPSSWLVKFETSLGIPRDTFKEFLASKDLPNIPYIVEEIKKMGGIEYKGAKSYLIAKEKSLKQEKYWEEILKKKFGEDVGVQFKFKKCIFDFIRISEKILYECKLSFKDFDERQYDKYMATLDSYSLVYLIGYGCIVDLGRRTIYTTENTLALDTLPAKFLSLISSFSVQVIRDVEEYFSL